MSNRDLSRAEKNDDGELAESDERYQLPPSETESLHTEQARTTRSARADLSQNNPHDVMSGEFGGSPAWKEHPQLSNPVVSASDVTDLNNVRFIADPFWRAVDGTIHLLAEIKHDDDGDGSYSQNIGYWKGPSPDSLSYQSGTVLDGQADGVNYSYSLFRKIDDQWYLLPSHSGNGVQIYTFDGFDSTPSPTLQETILTGAANSDPTPIWWEGRWYLITTTNGQATLWYADEGRSITGRSWTEHANSPIGADSTEEGGAGRAHVYPHHIELPIEDQTNTQVRWFRITDLSTSSFSWSEVDTSPILRGDNSLIESTWRRTGMHHMDILAGDWGGEPMAIVDGKDENHDWSLGVAVPTATKSAYARIFKSSSLGAQTMDGSEQTVTFDTVAPDFERAFSEPDNGYVAPTTGWYDVDATLQFTGQTSDHQIYATLHRDGSEVRFSENDLSGSQNHRQSLTINQSVYLLEGQVLTVVAKANNGEVNEGRTVFEVQRANE
ncbi:hypothetical protein G9464_20940 [Halostella sp. JP-L12]|uniref:hypothetical protein n=1 Tax=Halostella TaxID=1843185 RepID=UPI000EF79866|nr:MULTISPECIES: hypothetical protein [Halostella]NHN50039.1 hypothetical protein [Halostella sp. JP-L12]